MTTWGTDRWTLIQGDSAEVLKDLPDACVDSVVCDPPAGIGFMGKAWDGDRGGSDEWIAWLAGIMSQALRVLKPGGHALVWALPRTAHWTMMALECSGWEIRDVVTHLFGTGFPKSKGLAPGVGTALKPAAEFWILARKPLTDTTTATYAQHGTGGLQIDACRVGDETRVNPPRSPKNVDGTLAMGGGWNPDAQATECTGRWPANVVHTDVLTDEEGGQFFYCPKPSRAEKDAGCDDLPHRTGGEATGREDGSKGAANPRAGSNRGGGRNIHPTIKAQALMRYLVRLVTPPGGIVLDPFAGSGSTLAAAMAEGCCALGIEREAEYCEIARRRAAHAEAAGDA